MITDQLCIQDVCAYCFPHGEIYSTDAEILKITCIIEILHILALANECPHYKLKGSGFSFLAVGENVLSGVIFVGSLNFSEPRRRETKLIEKDGWTVSSCMFSNQREIGNSVHNPQPSVISYGCGNCSHNNACLEVIFFVAPMFSVRSLGIVHS